MWLNSFPASKILHRFSTVQNRMMLSLSARCWEAKHNQYKSPFLINTTIYQLALQFTHLRPAHNSIISELYLIFFSFKALYILLKRRGHHLVVFASFSIECLLHFFPKNNGSVNVTGTTKMNSQRPLHTHKIIQLFKTASYLNLNFLGDVCWPRKAT